ncbi:MAG: hypothetical protein WBE26_06855 [Phycisphaerae bacterium]
MSQGEIVGLLLTVALLAAIVGAVLTAVAALRRDRAAELRTRQIDAYAQWLAARMTLSRASVSFVVAFRALAAQRRDSDYFLLRRDEAQRARADWCDARRELDRAEAVLVAWSDDPSIRKQLARFDLVAPDVLRLAINSDQGDVDRLAQRLHDADQRAAEFVHAATASTRASRFPARKRLTVAADYVESIVEHWTKRS